MYGIRTPALVLPENVTMASQPVAGNPPFSNVTIDGVDAHWSSNNPTGTQFVLESFWANGPGPSSTTVHPTFARVDGLTPDTDYLLQVSAINWKGVRTTATVLGSTRTLQATVVISSPTELSASRLATGQTDRLDLQWRDNSTGAGEEDRFWIYQWTDNSSPVQVATAPAVLGAGTTTGYLITGLSPNTRYHFYVVAKILNAS
jgi:hypothetical protein